MEFFFRPERLQTVQKEIAELHKSKKEMLETWKLSVDEELKELIISLVSLDTSELAIEAYMLSDREMYQIAGYLPYNYFNVNMRNLFSIFVTRADKLLCTVLYEQWQNSYDNKDCNDPGDLNICIFQRCIHKISVADIGTLHYMLHVPDQTRCCISVFIQRNGRES